MTILLLLSTHFALFLTLFITYEIGGAYSGSSQIASLDIVSLKGSIDTRLLGEGAPCMFPDPASLNYNDNSIIRTSLHDDKEIRPMLKLVMGKPPLLWELSGAWQLSIDSGKVIDFYANFNMSGLNEELHTHSVTNFKPDLNTNSVPIQFNPNGLTRISGIVDFKQTCHDTLTGVPVSLEIDGTANEISIAVDSAAIDNHFGGESIDGYIEFMNEIPVISASAYFS
ncbi:MAG: hypothetical protein WA941_18950 [Nitrososphaeraceae archaeon]